MNARAWFWLAVGMLASLGVEGWQSACCMLVYGVAFHELQLARAS